MSVSLSSLFWQQAAFPIVLSNDFTSFSLSIHTLIFAASSQIGKGELQTPTVAPEASLSGSRDSPEATPLISPLLHLPWVFMPGQNVSSNSDHASCLPGWRIERNGRVCIDTSLPKSGKKIHLLFHCHVGPRRLTKKECSPRGDNGSLPPPKIMPHVNPPSEHRLGQGRG